MGPHGSFAAKMHQIMQSGKSTPLCAKNVELVGLRENIHKFAKISSARLQICRPPLRIFAN
jgi:hypothetical protein